MLFVDNPVLQRELLTNLRAPRAFVLLLVYQLALAAVVIIATHAIPVSTSLANQPQHSVWSTSFSSANSRSPH